jgi:chemotaxis protein CheD
MIVLFEQAGAKPRDVEVKCFGGADLFSKKIEKPGTVSVGRQNVMTAEKVLAHEGFRIAKQDVGGLRGRKLYFYTHTGEVLLKRLSAGRDPISLAVDGKLRRSETSRSSTP